MRKPTVFYLSLTGMIGPLLFTLMTIICSGLRVHYSHMNQFISELGATGTPHNDLMNRAGFIPSGLLIVLFGVCLFRLLPGSFATRTGAILVSLFGVGLTIAGLYSCDQGCPPEGGSFENMLHNKISGPAFMSAIIAIFLFSLAFRRLDHWRSFWIYSLVSSAIAVIFTVMLLNTLESPGKGLWQRLLLGTIFLWLAITAINLYNSGTQGRQPKSDHK